MRRFNLKAIGYLAGKNEEEVKFIVLNAFAKSPYFKEVKTKLVEVFNEVREYRVTVHIKNIEANREAEVVRVARNLMGIPQDWNVVVVTG
jgi:hypothetical protein